MRFVLPVLLLLFAGEPIRAAVDGVRFAGIAGGELTIGVGGEGPVLLANTASLCGFTPQYADLQAVWERYRDRGLTVVGVPTNDFGGQEPGSAAEIKEFCEVNFAVDFPLTAKVTTRGADQHPFFAAVEASLGSAALPRWNFHKYLIDADGRIVAEWPSHVRPTGPEITRAIEGALADH